MNNPGYIEKRVEKRGRKGGRTKLEKRGSDQAIFLEKMGSDQAIIFIIYKIYAIYACFYILNCPFYRQNDVFKRAIIEFEYLRTCPIFLQVPFSTLKRLFIGQ
jgi:hypothetical protein